MPMPRKLTKSQSEQVCRRYLDGEDGTQLAKAFSTCSSTIYNIMKRQGVPRRSARMLTSKQSIEIANRYKLGESAPQLAIAFDVSDTTIRNTLERLGISRRTLHEAHFRYSFNESVFDVITEETAYWIGFLMADGCVEQKARSAPRISICLSIRDYEHLKLFLSFLQSSHPVTTWRQTARVTIHSAHIAKVLSSFGVVPRKSLSAQVIGLENNRHFWRGVIDGDGSLKHHRRQKTGWKESYLALYGSNLLLQQFVTFIQSYILNKKVSVKPMGTIYRVSLTGSSAIQIVHLLYHPCAVSLARKQNQADQFPSLLF